MVAALDLGLLLGIISALAVFAGLVFNGLQVRHAQEQRRLEGAAEIMHTFQSREFVQATGALWELPEDLSAEAARKDPRVVDAIITVGVAYETLGVMVHRRIVPLDMVQDVMGGACLFMWRRSQRYIEAERVRQKRDNVFEWFQWLAERLEEHADAAKKAGAQVAHRDWKP